MVPFFVDAHKILSTVLLTCLSVSTPTVYLSVMFLCVYFLNFFSFFKKMLHLYVWSPIVFHNFVNLSLIVYCVNICNFWHNVLLIPAKEYSEQGRKKLVYVLTLSYIFYVQLITQDKAWLLRYTAESISKNGLPLSV